MQSQRSQTEAVTFLANHDDSRALYAIPGKTMCIKLLTFLEQHVSKILVDLNKVSGENVSFDIILPKVFAHLPLHA